MLYFQVGSYPYSILFCFLVYSRKPPYRVVFHNSEYQNSLPKLLSSEKSKELGLLFVDHSGDLPNFDAIKYVSRMRPRMEILIYLPARTIKRLFHLTGKSLLGYMEEIGKKNWLIRKPVKWDNMEWTFLLGSNTDIFKDYKNIDFYRLSSKEAQYFFPKLNLTSRQRMAKLQSKLPGM